MLRKLGQDALIAGSPDQLMQADHIILPGVGAFDTGMRNLQSSGFLPALTHKVMLQKIPLLGICLGMQLLTEDSQEGGEKGLGWIAAHTLRLAPGKLKVPHMGWNQVQPVTATPLWDAADWPDWRFYFVHSYYVECSHPQDVSAHTHYGTRFASVIQRDNIVACQFHPEKSHRFGFQLLRNFLKMSSS